MKEFSKTAGRLAVLAGLLGAMQSCDLIGRDNAPEEVTATVEVSIRDLKLSNTRSCVGDNTQGYENTMRNMALFQFTQDGTLFRSYYFPSLSGNLSVQGRSGEEYTFVGLMNMGDMTISFPVGTRYSEIENYTYNCGAMPDLSSGCPMSCTDASLNMSKGGGVLSLVFTRLVARYDFRLDCSRLKYGSFNVTSLKLRQAPSKVTPLLPPSTAGGTGDVRDGDYATQSNLSLLRNGQAVPFYVLENAQGTLLENNTDPWAKVPSQLGNKGALCTYIELTGTYAGSSGQLTATHTYRMYLGDDSTTNFDILRGTRYDLTLTLSDDGFLRATWKAERQIISDTRSLYFSPSNYEVSYGQGKTVTLVGNDGCSFTLSSGLSSAGVTFDASTMTLSQTRQLSSDVTGTLTATTWDRALTATCTVTALRYRRQYTLYCYNDYQWYYDEDQVGDVTENYIEEWVYFKAVTSDGTELPCRFKIPGFPGCGDYQERFDLTTYGDDRIPGPADMPERQITPEIMKMYPLYVMVDGEESCPSWSSVIFRSY